MKGIHPHDIATILDDDGVAIRAGHHCCQILRQTWNSCFSKSINWEFTITKEDMDILCESINKCKKVFKV